MTLNYQHFIDHNRTTLFLYERYENLRALLWHTIKKFGNVSNLTETKADRIPPVYWLAPKCPDGNELVFDRMILPCSGEKYMGF